MEDEFYCDDPEMESLEEIDISKFSDTTNICNNELLTREERITIILGRNPYVVDENGIKVTQAIID